MKMVCRFLNFNINYCLIFLVLPILLWSQIKVSGVIYGENKEIVSYANLTVYNESETTLLTYTISDENGKYNLLLEEGTYVFIINHIGYKSHSIKKEIDQEKTIIFELKKNVRYLDEIILESKPLEVYESNDTVQYNFNQLMTGNEKKLKDVINKLPGIEIDENGKIKAYGKKIDNLLIDGKEFFGDQHQLATENIDYEMISGITLFKNYRNFSDLSNQKKTGKIALNVEIEESYKGRLKGNVNVAAGLHGKFEINSNLFSFEEKINLYFISGINNIGSQTFSFEDYISFQGGIQKLLKSNSSIVNISGEDLPYYLLSNKSVESKDEKLSAINFSYNPSKKMKINSYVIFDKINIIENQIARQTYISNDQNSVLELETNKINSFNINNSSVNISYELSDKSFIDYSLSYSPQKNDLLSSVFFTQRFYRETKSLDHKNLNQTFKFKKQNKNYFLSTVLFQTHNNKNEKLKLSSNQDFLNLNFEANDYSVLQKTENYFNSFGLDSSISVLIAKKIFFGFNHIFLNSNEVFQSEVFNNPLTNKIRLNTLENVFGLSLFKERKTLVNYNLGINFSFLKISNLINYNFLPYIMVKLNFRQNHFLQLRYKKTLEQPAAKNITTNKYISNFNTFTDNQNLTPNSITKYDNLSIQYYLNDLFSGTFLNLGGNLIFGNNIRSINTFNFDNYRVNFHFIGDNDVRITSHFLFDKKFSKIPFNIRFISSLSLTQKNNFTSNISNKIFSNIFSNNLKLSSNLKESIYNFELGLSRKQNLIKNNFTDGSSVTKTSLHAKLFINYNRLGVVMSSAMESFRSRSSSMINYSISPKVNYDSKNRKWTFYIKGDNISNFHSNTVIENTAYESFFEEKKVSTLSGYIISGLKYNF